MNQNDTSGFLDALNDSQRLAVEYCDGPSLVIAGAGSGKTRVLTYKVAYLLTRGVKPWNILALTFTNKAANEMKERINKLVGGNQSRYIYMGTFHSIFSRMLRREAELIGYNQNFTIYDAADSKSLVNTIVKELGLNDKVYKPGVVASRISMAKNHLIMPVDYANDHEAIARDCESRMPDLLKVYANYQERLKRANVMDFDDLLVNTYLLFKRHPEVLERYADNFEYILVDEYQDTNAVQQRIVSQLASRHHRVCAVGDDAQSIYAFRGANIDNILGFDKAFSGSRVFKLEQNYRSTQRIVEAANSLIRHNTRQIPKNVYSRNNEGERLKLKMAYSDREEAIIVCNDIKKMVAQGFGYNDIAVLYRTNSQSRSLEEALRKASIPYRIYGGLSFYQRKEIKDVIGYFRLVANPDDEEALKRVINYPTRGIGQTTIDKIKSAAELNEASLWSVAEAPERYQLKINGAARGKLAAFVELINGFRERLQTEDAYTLGFDIVKKSGVAADLYSGREPEDIARQENLEEFLSGVQDFVEARADDPDLSKRTRLEDFLQEVSLLTDADNVEDENAPTVGLMTVHSAKGLEFPVVFIVGLEENIFPSPMSCDTIKGLEEERRLLYVAITRAGQHCIMTCARNRFRFGRMEFDTPSRFIKDIDQRLIDVSDFTRAASSTAYGDDDLPFNRGEENYDRYRGGGFGNSRGMVRREASPRVDDSYHFTNGGSGKISRVPAVGGKSSSAVPSSSDSRLPYGVGTVIEHSRFGIGKIVGVEGKGEYTKATVEFQNAGRKQLLMKFAKFKIIN